MEEQCCSAIKLAVEVVTESELTSVKNVGAISLHQLCRMFVTKKKKNFR